MSARKLLKDMNPDTGWDTHTELALMGDYITHHASLKGFEQFLREARAHDIREGSEHDLVSSWINGNRKDVANALARPSDVAKFLGELLHHYYETEGLGTPMAQEIDVLHTLLHDVEVGRGR